jgi:hypothetical protein
MLLADDAYHIMDCQGEKTMMGSKARLFAPVVVASLDELVPPTHFYRHLDRVVDLYQPVEKRGKARSNCVCSHKSERE